MVLKTKFIMTLMLVPFNTEFSVKSPLSYYQYMEEEKSEILSHL